MNQAEVKRKLSYCKLTGVFTWLSGSRKGMQAGCAHNTKGKSYINLKVSGTSYLAHRLAFLYVTGRMPVNEVDHINGNGLDNSWRNMRDVTRSENGQNQKLFSTNKSGITGVRYIKSRNKWRAIIMSNGSSRYLGDFKDKFNAICARKSADAALGFHPNHGAERLPPSEAKA